MCLGWVTLVIFGKKGVIIINHFHKSFAIFLAIHLVFGIPFMMMGWHGAANGAPFIPCNLTMAHIASGLAHRMEGLRLFLQCQFGHGLDLLGRRCLVLGGVFRVREPWHLRLVYKHDTLRIATYDYGSTPWYPRYLKVPGNGTVIPTIVVIIHNNDRRKFRSQTSDKWTDEKQSWAEAERREE